jgi:fimbrial isopeptide formation D2 family protein
MQDKLKRTFRRLSLGVVAVFVMLALGLASTAGNGVTSVFADPVIPSTLPTNATGSLSIHKYVSSPSQTNLPHDGSALQSSQTSGLTPLSGVTFQIQQVMGIDLSTNSGWQDTGELSQNFDVAAVDASSTSIGSKTLGTARSMTTDGSGVARFANLPIGLYLVQEASTPSGVIPSLPFLVTVPITTDADKSTWNYDVNVYPKNAKVSAAKSVDDGNTVQLGDKATWTVESTIALRPGADVFDGYEVSDPLDPRLSYVDDSVAVFITSSQTGAVITTLVLGDDYTVTAPTAGNKNTLKVDFTIAGLAKLAVHNLDNVRVNFKTTATASGSIPNQAVVYIDGPDHATASSTITTNIPDERFGGIQIHKQDSATQKVLSGASFSVYTRLLPSGKPDPSSKVTVDNGTSKESVWTTGADGLVAIDGLRYSCYADGAAITDASGKTPCTKDNAGTAQQKNSIMYYLVETKAPTGYTVFPSPIPFTVDGAATRALAQDGQAVAEQMVIDDAKATSEGHRQTPIIPKLYPDLPGDGLAQTGVSILVIVGIGAAGFLIFLVTRRRRSK